MLIPRTFFEEFYAAVQSGAVYAFGPQMPLSKKGIVLIRPGTSLRLGSDVAFTTGDASRLNVSLVGYTSKKPFPTGSAATLSPEEIGLRREETFYSITLIRLRLELVQLFLTPAVDVAASKNWSLELQFVELGKTVSLTPSSLAL
ncbi:MAG: hypothetical protein WA001_01470 [Patescibacteria group bacterium]